jgi:hypothetical protein
MVNAELQREICGRIKRNLDAAQRQLDNGDIDALRALATEEAQMVDLLRAVWSL